MRPFIQDALTTLYGAERGREAAGALERLLARAPRPPSTPLGSGDPHNRLGSLSQRDALLICYADQITEPELSPLRALARFAGKYLRNLTSGIHLLPFYPWSSDDGFSVKDYTAVDPQYGSWDDVAEIGRDFDLMLDAVINHASVEGKWFRRFLEDDPVFRDFFVTVEGNPPLANVVRPRTLPLLTEFQTNGGPRRVWTTFSPDQADLNYKSPDLLLAILEVLLLYVANGARFIRLDAIAFLWKEIGTSCLHLPQTHMMVQLFRAVLDEVAPHVLLITETNVPHSDNISYFGDGTNEAQLVYNFALPPLVLHALQSGNAEKLTRWAQDLSFPSRQATYFNFLASHDGIGLNPARGILSETEITAMAARTLARGGFVSFKSMPDGSESPYELNINYLDAVSLEEEPVQTIARKFLTAQAIMLSLRGVPGIYFHSLFGSRGDPQAAASTGIKRRINRQKLECQSLEGELRDASSLRALVFNGYQELLRTRQLNPAFAPSSPQQILPVDPRVFAVLRETSDQKDRVLCVHNVSGEAVDLDNPSDSVALKLPPFGCRWLTLA